MSSTSIHVDSRSGLPASAVTIGIATLLTPVAYLQFGLPGIGIVALFAVAVMLSVWLSTRCAAAFRGSQRATAGLLAASGIRMVLPLSVAIVIVIQADRYVPISA